MLKISPHAKNTSPERMTKETGVVPNFMSAKMPKPSIKKAQNIVFSRPTRSEMKPSSGRVTPFMMLFSDSAKVNAGKVIPSSDTGNVST